MKKDQTKATELQGNKITRKISRMNEGMRDLGEKTRERNELCSEQRVVSEWEWVYIGIG